MWTKVAGGNNGTSSDGDPFEHTNDLFILQGITGGSHHYNGEYCLTDVVFSFRNGFIIQHYPSIGKLKPPSQNLFFQWSVPAGQKINFVDVTFGRYVNTLQFTTNTGVVSPILGEEKGKQHMLIDVRDTFIRGFGGRAGDIVDQLKFYLNK